MDVFKLFGTVIVETKDAIEALQDTAKEAEKTSKSAEKVGDGFSESGKKSKESGNNIINSFSKVAKAGAVVVGAVTAIVTAMVELAESTREYRLEMGKLETAFTNAGHTTEEATETYRTLYSVLGETDRSVEAAQHIAKLCDNEEQMRDMTNACIGAFALFDDSLPIEGLMEAANETAKTGQLTGVLADALNWAGANEEAFQKKLNDCNTERERTALIIETLNSLYGEAAEAYKKNNEEVIAATAAQDKLNAATARWGELVEPAVTLFKEGLADSINFAADAFENMASPTEKAAKALVGTIETSEEAAAKVAELRARMEEFSKNTKAYDYKEGMERFALAIEIAEARLGELTEAERLAAEEASKMSDATAESVAKFTEITNQYVADAMTLFENFTATYEGVYSKVSGWFDPFEKAKVSVKTNIEEMMAAMQSQVDFNNAYNANLQALKDYGLGGLSEAFQSYGANGSAYAQAIVAAVEQAGGATTAKGQEIIQGFAEINQKVTESQEGLSQTMTLMDGEFESQLQSMVEKYGESIEGLDKSAEASTAAKNTFDAFLKGMNEKLPAIQSQMKTFGQQITSALRSGIGTVTIPVQIKTTGTIPGHATGLDFVPYDNYLAYLHKGEAVLTAEEATAWRAGKEAASMESTGDSGTGSGGVTVNQYIEAVPQTPVELASITAAYFEQARWIT